MSWILNQLDKHGRKAVIPNRDHTADYLTRYYVLWPDSIKRERKDIPFNSFIHQFNQSDDPVFHTHPWNWFHSLILKGGYWEHTPWGTTWYGPGSMRYVDCQRMRHLRDDPYAPLVPANLHWVECPKKDATWTLFTRGRTINKAFWGFLTNEITGQIIHHEEYLANVSKYPLIGPNYAIKSPYMG